MEQATNGSGNGTAAEPKLKRSMGLWMATALVIGNMVGSGIFLLPASLASVAGPVSIIGWIFTGIGAMLPPGATGSPPGRATPPSRSRSSATSRCSGAG